MSHPSPTDDFPSFKLEYVQHVREISKIVEEMYCYESSMAPFEEHFDVQVCWQVTNNIKLITAKTPNYNPIVINSTDANLCSKIISDALTQNKLVTIKYEAIEGYDPNDDGPGPEHHLSCIGSDGKGLSFNLAKRIRLILKQFRFLSSYKEFT